MKLALYKGPAQDWRHKLAHWAVCTFTGSIYSHCELVIHGVCWSSSARDGGVRGKVIDLASGRWDVVDVHPSVDEARALAWFQAHAGQAYDWAGVLRFALPVLPRRADQWFCSEACAAATGIPCADDLQPHDLPALLT
jgi:hypothetical protein